MEPYIHTIFCEMIILCINFSKSSRNIRKGVNFNIIFKLQAFNLARQNVPQMLSWCPENFRASYFCASPNRWFSCRRKDHHKDSFTDISGFYAVVFKPKDGTCNSYKVLDCVLSFLFREITEIAVLRFLQNRCS